MKRRTFLRGLASAACMRVLLRSPSAMAQKTNPGPAFFLVHAGGGWDTANGLDPRLKGGEDELAITTGQKLIQSVGPFRHRLDHPKIGEFLTSYGEDLAVIILKMDSNDHGAGTDNMATGSMAMEDPAIGALFAKTYADGVLPTPFIVAGGSIKTGSLVPVANLGSVSNLQKVLTPNQINQDTTYYPGSVAGLLNSFRKQRLAERLSGAHLPSHMKALEQLLMVAQGKEELSSIASELSQAGEGFDPVTEVLLDLVELDMVRAVSLSEGGFDTHGGDGQQQLPSLMAKYFGRVTNLWSRAKERGLSGKVLIVGGSEFSRTPNLNGGKGTDHWPGTNTVFLLGHKVKPQVIGQSDEAWYAQALDPKTFVPKAASAGGVIPTIADFHLALRQIVQIDPALLSQFPLSGSGLDATLLAKQLVA